METKTFLNTEEFHAYLKEMAQNQSDGSLAVSNNYVLKRFNFSNGNITAWSTSNRERQIGNIGFALLQLRLVSSENLLNAFIEQRAEKKHYCQILCEKKLLTESDIQLAASAVVSEEICEVFTWQEGKYEVSNNHFPSSTMYGTPYLQSLLLCIPVAEVLGKIPSYLTEWNFVMSSLNNLETILVMNNTLAKELQDYIQSEVAIYDNISDIAGTDKIFDSSISQRIQKDLAFFNGRRTLKEIIGMISSERLSFCKFTLDLQQKGYLRPLQVDEIMALAQHNKNTNNLVEAKKYFGVLLAHPAFPAENRGAIEKIISSLQIPHSMVKTQVVGSPSELDVEFPGYEIIEEIGKGAMGTVYKARQKSLNRFVAIKVIPPTFSKNELYIKRLELEAKAMARLKHPNIVSAIDFGFQNQYYYIIMEYVEQGRSLQSNVDEKGAMGEKEVLEVGLSISNAIKYLAENNLVHRDIKPSNILVDKDGTPKLGDLGLIKDIQADAGLTMPGTSVGTPAYMSPEQLQTKKDIDVRSDIYSLGATLLHCLTGKSRFGDSTSVGIIYHKIITERQLSFKRMGNMSDAMDAILVKMLQPRREERYQTPEELIVDIELLLTGHKPRVSTASAQKKIWKSLSIAGAASIILVGTAFGIAKSGILKKQPPVAPVASQPEPPQTPKTTPSNNTGEPPVVPPRENVDNQLAIADGLYQDRKYEEVISETLRIIARDDSSIKAYYLRGMSYLYTGEAQKAQVDFTRLIELKPSCEYYVGLGYSHYVQGDFSKALDAFANAQKLESNNPEIYYAQARVFLAQNRAESATESAKKALEADSTFWKARYIEALLWGDNKPKETCESIKIAIQGATGKTSPTILVWLQYYQGILQSQLNQDNEAWQTLETAFAKIKARELAAYLGWVAIKQDKLAEALKYFRSSQELPELDVKGSWEIDIAYLSKYHLSKDKLHYGRGKAYWSLKNYESAIQELTAAVDFNSNFKEALELRLDIYQQQQNHMGIIGDITALLNLDPNRLDYYWIRGKALFEQKKYEVALNDLSLLIKNKYQLKDVLNLRTQIYLELNNDKAAVSDLDAFLKIDPKNPDALLLRATLSEKNGKFKQATDDYLQIIALRPDFKQAYEKLIDIYNNPKKHKVAASQRYKNLMQVYDKYLTIDPDNTKILYNRGAAYAEVKNFSNAIRDLTKVLEQDKQHEGAYFYRGMSNFQLQKYQEAISDLSYAVAINPRRVEAYNMLGEMLEKNREYAQAVESFSQFLAARPTDHKSLHSRARCRIQLRNYTEAISDLTQVLRFTPDNKEALELLGICQAETGEYQTALANFAKAEKKESLNAEIWKYRGLCQYHINLFDESIAAYQRAISMKPQLKMEVASKLALAYIAQGALSYQNARFPEAIQQFSSAVELEPDNSDAYYNRGMIYYFKMKDYEKAITDFTQVIRIKPTMGASYCYRGLCFFQIKKYAEADEDFKMTLRYERDEKYTKQAQKYRVNIQKILQGQGEK